MLVPDPIVFQQLAQNRPIKLRPPRPCKRPHIADELDFVLLEQFEKIRERMPAVADGVDR